MLLTYNKEVASLVADQCAKPGTTAVVQNYPPHQEHRPGHQNWLYNGPVDKHYRACGCGELICGDDTDTVSEIGTFKRGVLHGFGERHMRDGTVHIGSFDHGLLHGLAFTQLTDGTSHTGTWWNGNHFHTVSDLTNHL